ncbi:type II secretion system F family protein [bacterium]|nr:type II secretion system F family protein [bacterium]QQR56399.1 MAG: type II secretion system F family protein [Candidatus Melainabacteria bacterium]
MSNTVIAILTFAVCLGAGLLILRPVLGIYVDSYAVRVKPKKESEETAAEKPKDSALLALCKTIGELVLSVMPAVADKRTVELLIQANYRTPDHLAIYMGIRSMLCGLVLGLGFLAGTTNPINLVLSLPAAVLAWLIPNFFLAGRAKKRQSDILRELPVVIDLMLVCAQAGLGLLMSIDKVSKETEDSCPILAVELRQLINDVKVFAKSVPYALREMGERCGVDELINMASALIAAEQKGSDISYPLQQQAEALRDRLKRKKEEEAGKVPVKMVPVIMIFIMPLILAPMLGPAVVTIVTAIGPIMQGIK